MKVCLFEFLMFQIFFVTELFFYVLYCIIPLSQRGIGIDFQVIVLKVGHEFALSLHAVCTEFALSLHVFAFYIINLCNVTEIVFCGKLLT